MDQHSDGLQIVEQMRRDCRLNGIGIGLSAMESLDLPAVPVACDARGDRQPGARRRSEMCAALGLVALSQGSR